MWTPDTSVIETEETREAAREETRRAAIPDLSSRQFWLTALELGVTKAGLLEKARADYEGADLENMLILIGESSTFSRHNPIVESLSAELGIPADNLDSLWTWAATI